MFMSTSRLIRLSAVMTLLAAVCVAADDPTETEATDRVRGTVAATEVPALGAGGLSAGGLAALQQGEQVDYRLRLPSGRTIDVGEIFRPHGEAFTESLRRQMRVAKSPLVRLNHDPSGQPLLLAGRRGKVLHGPFASFAEDGTPVALISYTKGERNSALLTWDDAHRPLVFAEYSAGELDGMRCLFRSCCDECRSGHIWMVQEWQRGELQTAHVVGDDGEPLSFDYQSGLIYGTGSSELDEATAALAMVDLRIEADEVKLKNFVAAYYERQRQAAYDQVRFNRAQMNYRFMANVYRPPVRSGSVKAVM